MAFAMLAASATLMTEAAPLDGNALAQVIRDQVKTRAAAPLEGRRFRLELPVAWQKSRKLPSFKNPAVWRYDRKDGRLVVAVGFGQLSPQNYDQFDAQGLAALPPLQTAVFKVSEAKSGSNRPPLNTSPDGIRRPPMYAAPVITDIQGQGDEAWSQTVSYSLAVPLGEHGEIAGMPSSFKPLMVYSARTDDGTFRKAVDAMKLVVEGEVTSFGSGGSVVCGLYRGGIEAHELRTAKTIMMTDKQCFVAARITYVAVAGKGGYYLQWGVPATWTAEVQPAGSPGR